MISLFLVLVHEIICVIPRDRSLLVINEELLIGGISIYNDAGMTVRKELFNRKTVERIMIPFDLKSYLRYYQL